MIKRTITIRGGGAREVERAQAFAIIHRRTNDLDHIGIDLFFIHGDLDAKRCDIGRSIDQRQ